MLFWKNEKVQIHKKYKRKLKFPMSLTLREEPELLSFSCTSFPTFSMRIWKVQTYLF